MIATSARSLRSRPCSRGRAAQWRPCRIEPAALKDVDDWLERYRGFWEASLDRLDEYLKELQAKDKKAKQKHVPKKKSLTQTME